MAWNVQRQNSSPSTEQLVAAAAQVLEQQQSESLRRVDTLDVARSFPLLQAPQSSTTDEQQFRHALDAQSRNPRVSEPSTSRASGANVDQEREKLFRAMGKFLDPTSAAEGHRDPIVQEGYAQQTPAYYQEPIRRQYGGMPSPDRMTAEQQAAFQAMKISSYAEEERKSWAPQPQYEIVQDTAPSSLPSPTLGVQQIRLRSPPRDNVASGKKRTRGSTPVASTSAPVTSTKEDAIAPSLALKDDVVAMAEDGDVNMQDAPSVRRVGVRSVGLMEVVNDARRLIVGGVARLRDFVWITLRWSLRCR
ncbi:hypothetical protein PHYBOEH_007803 [Phytophthora boehmeriae]|uniref:Uncharacterized protein n=1 Tax=Phytophthora boehmeriae TaxID=109152 RepID=A0A8T1W9Z4_9STRA|nr:hypothetical protein PHYBOEH_007803 [Phytophthora boehmeriae]